MKNKIIANSFLLLISTSCLAGCGTKRTVIDQDIKNAYSSVKEKTDKVNALLAESSYEDKGERRATKVNRDEIASNAKIEILPTHEYLAEAYFSMYVFSCVNYNIQYGYEPHGINFGDKIVGQVRNELNEQYRNLLTSTRGTTDFYFQMSKDGNDLKFVVDWKRENNISHLADKPDYHGTIRVDGLIKRDENLEVSDLYIASCVDNYSHYISCSHYDFKQEKVYLYNIGFDGENNVNNDAVVNDFNNGTLTYSKILNYGFNRLLVATSNITDNLPGLDFDGYMLENHRENQATIHYSLDSEDENTLITKYDEVYQTIHNYKIRNSSQSMNYKGAKKVDFLDRSLEYGLAKTKIYIDSKNQVNIAYIEKESFLKQIDSYLQNETSSEARDGLNQLKTALNQINEEDYLSGFSNENYFLRPVDAGNYRYNAYKCPEFYYIFGGRNINGTLKIELEGNKISNVKFAKKHNINWKNDGEYRREKISVVPFKYDYVLRTDVIGQYRYCYDLDCDEMIQTWKYEITYIAKDVENPEFDDFGNEIIYSYGDYRNIEYSFNEETYEFNIVYGNQYDYQYNESSDTWLQTYSAQLEYNENTNYELYPMHEYFYSYEVNENENGCTATYKNLYKNNWLHIEHIMDEISFTIKVKEDHAFETNGYQYTYGMNNGKFFKQTENTFTSKSQYIFHEGINSLTISTSEYLHEWTSYNEGGSITDQGSNDGSYEYNYYKNDETYMYHVTIEQNSMVFEEDQVLFQPIRGYYYCPMFNSNMRTLYYGYLSFYTGFQL